MTCVRKKSITYENNRSCKHRLVIVLRLHIECNFSLAFFFFHYHSLPRSLSTIQIQKIAVIFSLFLPLWATLGEKCLLSVQRDVKFENKGRKLLWADFKMGVTSTLPQPSEWTLHMHNFLMFFHIQTGHKTSNKCIVRFQ